VRVFCGSDLEELTFEVFKRSFYVGAGRAPDLGCEWITSPCTIVETRR